LRTPGDFFLRSIVSPLALAALFLAAPTGCRSRGANPGSVLLPVVADAGGALGRHWKTALTFSACPADSVSELDLTFWDREGAPHRTRTVLAPGGGLRIDDLFAFLRGSIQPPLPDGALIGPLAVRATRGKLPLIRVEIYGVEPTSGGRLGQSYDSESLHRAAESESRTLAIAGLPTQTDFRSNLGVINPGDKPIEVEIRLYDLESGAVIGDSTRLKIEPHRTAPLSNSTKTLHAPAESRSVTARIHATDDSSDFLAYGSVVDSRTEGPVFVAASPVR